MKVFISLPMRGRTDEEILAARKEIEDDLRARFKEEELTIIDSYFAEFPTTTSNELNIGVHFLGRSILKLAEADLVVFGEGWEEARGCRLEYDIAKAYDIDTLIL